MNNKYESVKDKVSGSLTETAGRLTNDKGMEYKGKLIKGRGKVRELASNVTDEAEDVKDKVFDSMKEANKFASKEIDQLKKKLNKNSRNDKRKNMVLVGLGLVAGYYILKTVFDNDDE